MAPLLLAAAISIGPEPVEGRDKVESRASTSSALTDLGISAVDAERAFAADARIIGLWTAFRKWAAPDAIMFTPQATPAAVFLKPLTDPAQALDWWPTASFLSCDGDTAVNTGGVARPADRLQPNGYFSTVWQRRADGRWRWTLDHGVI